MNTNRVKITQRMNPCMCGCRGTDPQHAATVKRVIRDYAAFDLVLSLKTRSAVVARGTYAHPEGVRVCYLVKIVIDGELRGQGHWYASRAWFGHK